jgi:UDPglucose 6-dehydrogenase
MKSRLISLLLLCCTLSSNSHAKIIRSVNHNLTIAVVGTGYVGLVTGAGLAEAGNKVICADVDSKKIEMLQKGIIPIYEPGLKELVDSNVTSGLITFTTDVADAIAQAQVIVIGVGTPMNENGSANLTYIESVLNTTASAINGFKVIVTKSTVPVGTGAWIRSYLESKGVPSTLFSLVSNPEFLREGNAVGDFLHPDRIVLGTESSQGLELMKEVYKTFVNNGTHIIYTTIPTSETIKYASNAFLAVKLSYINEIANLCDATGADIKTVAVAMGLDKRISPLFLNPGPGFGGSCFPKDSQALLYMADQKHMQMPVVQASITTNEMQKTKPAEKLLALLNNDIHNKKIAILGLAFKANTDDIRYSPAISTIEILLERGAIIKAFDPAAMDNMKAILPQITYCNSTYETVNQADAVIIMTEWNEFKNIDLQLLSDLVTSKVIVDSRNVLNISKLKELGFIFDTMGHH